MNPQVIVAGHICLDVIPTFGQGAGNLDEIIVPGKLIQVGPPLLSTGGAVSNTGLALHRLGIPTKLIGKIGDDLFGRAITGILSALSPDLASGMIVTNDGPTSYTIVVNPPNVDRIFFHCPGANDTFHPSEIPLTDVEGARILHFGYPPLMKSVFSDGGSALSDLFNQLRAKGISVSLDMARPDPDSEAGRLDWLAFLERVLPAVDLFAPSIDEILYMIDRPLYDALSKRGGADPFTEGIDGVILSRLGERLIGLGAAVVAIKIGSAGLYLRTSPDPARLQPLVGAADAGSWAACEILSPCMKVTVKGTTGSGDCTIAGLLASFVHHLSPVQAVTGAVATGACSVEQADATSGVPSWKEVWRRIDSGWLKCDASIPLEGWVMDDKNGVWYGPGNQKN
jgi:sugar/nucleoside kinase (ribokinase family)